MTYKLRIGIIGCGTIGGYVLDAVKEKKVGDAEVLMVCGRSEQSKGVKKVRDLGIDWVTDWRRLLNESTRKAIRRPGAGLC